jgi:hypothetical protein
VHPYDPLRHCRALAARRSRSLAVATTTTTTRAAATPLTVEGPCLPTWPTGPTADRGAGLHHRRRHLGRSLAVLSVLLISPFLGAAQHATRKENGRHFKAPLALSPPGERTKTKSLVFEARPRKQTRVHSCPNLKCELASLAAATIYLSNCTAPRHRMLMSCETPRLAR